MAKPKTPIPYTTFKSDVKSSLNELHRTFGGIINDSDFNTEYKVANLDGSSISGRILAAWKFDYQCKRNAELRNCQKFQNGTLK